MLHVTDLYRPYNDPDDHWDLACAYALARRGDAELLGVFIDYPQREQNTDPDVLAVAQMNRLTGKAVPVMVGSPRWIEPEDAAKAENEPALRGIRSLLEILRRSPRPVVISVLGSCRDVAMAGRLEPDLFAEKCAAIYLNAGSGTPDEAKAGRLEWNVQLDPRAYAAMFALPCPVYWMPCFEEAPVFQVSEYGTFYRFRQGDVLPQLSDGVQNFFAYVFLQGGSEAPRATAESLRPNWLRYLEGPKDSQLLARVNAMDRNMWCTGGFLHAVGKTVTRDGQIVPLGRGKGPGVHVRSRAGHVLGKGRDAVAGGGQFAQATALSRSRSTAVSRRHDLGPEESAGGIAMTSGASSVFCDWNDWWNDWGLVHFSASRLVLREERKPKSMDLSRRVAKRRVAKLRVSGWR